MTAACRRANEELGGSERARCWFRVARSRDRAENMLGWELTFGNDFSFLGLTRIYAANGKIGKSSGKGFAMKNTLNHSCCLMYGLLELNIPGARPFAI